MVCWNVRGRLPISANWTFFRHLSRLRHYEQILVEIVVFERGGYFECKFQGDGGRPPMTFGVRKLESLDYHVVLFAW